MPFTQRLGVPALLGELLGRPALRRALAPGPDPVGKDRRPDPLRGQGEAAP
jgi:hypothetical protein